MNIVSFAFILHCSISLMNGFSNFHATNHPNLCIPVFTSHFSCYQNIRCFYFLLNHREILTDCYLDWYLIMILFGFSVIAVLMSWSYQVHPVLCCFILAPKVFLAIVVNDDGKCFATNSHKIEYFLF